MPKAPPAAPAPKPPIVVPIVDAPRPAPKPGRKEKRGWFLRSIHGLSSIHAQDVSDHLFFPFFNEAAPAVWPKAPVCGWAPKAVPVAMPPKPAPVVAAPKGLRPPAPKAPVAPKADVVCGAPKAEVVGAAVPKPVLLNLQKPPRDKKGRLNAAQALVFFFFPEGKKIFLCAIQF